MGAGSRGIDGGGDEVLGQRGRGGERARARWRGGNGGEGTRGDGSGRPYPLHHQLRRGGEARTELRPPDAEETTRGREQVRTNRDGLGRPGTGKWAVPFFFLFFF
jgi:hypothetical protein